MGIAGKEMLNVVNAPVYTHLKLAAPDTATVFWAKHKVSVTSHSFEDFVGELLSRYDCGKVKERVTSTRKMERNSEEEGWSKSE